MIRTLRRKFVLGALLAFGILAFLLIAGIVTVGYVQMERSANEFLTLKLQETGHMQQPPRGELPPQPAFGYQIEANRPFSSYYVLEYDREAGLRLLESLGTEEEDTILEYAEQVMKSGRQAGKIGAYKYRTDSNGRGVRLVFLDNSIRAEMLLGTLRTACLGGLICLVLLFLILLPVSGRVVRSYAAHAERQKRFVTDAGHELKTPVAILQANLDALELTQGSSKWTKNMREQNNRLNELIKRLLFLARADEGSLRPVLEPVDFSQLLARETEAYQELMRERGLHFNIQAAQGCLIRGHLESLTQLVHILMDNAVRYSCDGGDISLSLQEKRRRVALRISNRVERLPDMPPERLFDRFSRADTARTQKNGGYGIGLSAAQAIVQIHQGQMEAAYPSQDTGAFTVLLPR